MGDNSQVRRRRPQAPARCLLRQSLSPPPCRDLAAQRLGTATHLASRPLSHLRIRTSAGTRSSPGRHWGEHRAPRRGLGDDAHDLQGCASAPTPSPSRHPRGRATPPPDRCRRRTRSRHTRKPAARRAAQRRSTGVPATVRSKQETSRGPTGKRATEHPTGTEGEHGGAGHDSGAPRLLPTIDSKGDGVNSLAPSGRRGPRPTAAAPDPATHHLNLLSRLHHRLAFRSCLGRLDTLRRPHPPCSHCPRARGLSSAPAPRAGGMSNRRRRPGLSR